MAMIDGVQKLKKKWCLHTTQAGVTLIEMLVVVFIIGIVSSVLLFNYSDFSTNVSLRNLAQDIALSIRKAQTYATSVRPIDGTSGIDSKTFPAYGVTFSTLSSSPGSPLYSYYQSAYVPTIKKFILYADLSTTGAGAFAYSPGGLGSPNTCGKPDPTTGECLESFNITTADQIYELCYALNNSSTETCVKADSGAYQPTVDIEFVRPAPDATICVYTGSAICQYSPYVKIIVKSAKGLLRTVEVNITGQISVQ